MDGFIHLHNHTEDSLLDGHASVEGYIQRAKEIGQDALAITDHFSLSGAYNFVQTANREGVTPIVGCEIYMAPENPEGAKAKRPIFYGEEGDAAKGEDVSGRGAYLHLTVLAKNQTGVENLFRMSSESAKLENTYLKPRVDFDMLTRHSEGLMVFSGCPSSEISTRFRLGQKDKAYEYANRLKDVFGDDFYIEIMDHGMSDDLERKLLPNQLEMSKKLNIPLIATNDNHYVRAEDAKSHEELLAIQSKTSMFDAPFDEGGPRFAFDGNQYYLKTRAEMLKLFPQDEFPGAIDNTLVVAEKVSPVKFKYDPHLKPKPVIPSGYTEKTYLRELVKKGFVERYGNSPREIQKTAHENIKKELRVLESSDYVGYVLVVHEYVNWARENFSTRDANGVIHALSVGLGRGSAAGSTVLYCLKIVEVCPVRYGLLFERFLSEGRGDVYKISYDDGSEEISVASGVRIMNTGERKYIHEINEGDIVVGEE